MTLNILQVTHPDLEVMPEKHCSTVTVASQRCNHIALKFMLAMVSDYCHCRVGRLRIWSLHAIRPLNSSKPGARTTLPGTKLQQQQQQHTLMMTQKFYNAWVANGSVQAIAVCHLQTVHVRVVVREPMYAFRTHVQTKPIQQCLWFAIPWPKRLNG